MHLGERLFRHSYPLCVIASNSSGSTAAARAFARSCSVYQPTLNRTAGCDAAIRVWTLRLRDIETGTWRLTFDMSGDHEAAQLALGSPLDGGISLHA